MVAPIVADGLTKRFGRVSAADRVSFAVEAGEVFGFLGPNGAGKSTTIRLLLGQLRPTEGQASLQGIQAADPASRVGVGYLPSDLAFDPRQNAGEVLEMLAQLRVHGGGPSTDPATTKSLLDRFGLDPTVAIGKLSRGNRQKVGVVQAFMSEPSVIILDEPTTGLDPLLQIEFQSLVAERAATGAAVLLSSHVLSEVEHLADRVGVIRQGRLLSVDTVAGLRDAAHQRLTITLAEPSTLPDGSARLDLESVPGVIDWELVGPVLNVHTSGSTQPILDALAGYSIDRITSTDHLEDLFLGLYQNPPPPPVADPETEAR